MLFLASPQNTGLHSRGPQTPKCTETFRQLIKPSLPSKTPGLGMSSPASSQKARGCQAPPPRPLHLLYSIHPVFPLRVLAGTLDLSSAPRSRSCLSYSLSVLWLLLGLSVGSSTTLKQTKQNQEQTKNTESLSFGPSALLNAGMSCSLHFRWSKCCTSFHLPHGPLVCLGSYASGPSRSPFSAPSLPWPWTLPSSPIPCL